MIPAVPEAAQPLSRQFDAALLDLDGTVYLGGVVIPEVPAALEQARTDGMKCVFVTNNASRPPAVVADILTAMGVPATAEAVLTSPEAAADMLAAAHPAGSRVLILGTQHLVDCVRAVGLEPVHTAADAPIAVVQGLSQELGWPQLAEACIALRTGADWVATNIDATLPTDRGMLPGNGSLVAALVTATGLHPRVAGKPERPLLDTAIARVSSQRPLVVGDRLDTDIEAAVTAGIPSLMPLTGVNSAADVLTAPAARRPTHVSFDLRGLVDPTRAVELTATSPTPDSWSFETDTAGTRVHSTSGAPEHPHEDAVALSLLAAVAQRTWQSDEAAALQTFVAADDHARAALVRLGLGG